MRKLIASAMIVTGLLWPLTALGATAANASLEETLPQKVAMLFADENMRAAVLVNTEPPLLWLAMMLETAQTPNARLFYLADMLASNYADGYWNDWADMAAQLLRDHTVEDSQFNDFEFNTNADGTTTARADFSPDWNHRWYYNYITHTAPDGSVWCLRTETADDRYASIVNTAVMRFHKGQIWFLTPETPPEADFYQAAQPTPPWDSDAGELAEERDFELMPCDMQVYFETDTSATPFTIRAMLYQTNSDHYAPAYQCVPQCYIEYA